MLSGIASDAQIPDDITINNAGNADSLAHKAVSEFLTDSELESHKIDEDAHHEKYADSNAIAAMGVNSDGNTLNHDKYTDGDAQSAMGALADSNAFNHDRFSSSEAVSAMGVKNDNNPLNHDRIESLPFSSITGTATDAQISNNITILNAENAGNADSLGGAAAQSYALKSELNFVPSPNYTFNLPSTQGGSGTVMSNDGAGNLSWVTPSGGGGGEVVDGAFSTTSNVTSNIPGNLAGDDFVFGSNQLDD